MICTVAVASAVALGGCTIHTTPEPTSYVEVTSAPADVEVYPRTYYEGRTVYYVDGRWMFRDRGRWVYYRTEPPELYRQRTVIQQAPPAYRSPPAYHRAPYERGGYERYPAQPAPQSAPPATRVQ